MKRLLARLLVLLLLPATGWSLTLKADTRWQGEIHLKESVRVERGVTLTIAPGSRVTFASGRLEVAGRLVASGVRLAGKGWEGVVLKGCGADTLMRDCTVVGARTGIFVVGGAPQLESLTLTGNAVGMELRQKSAATVTGCSIRHNGKVGLFIKDDAAPTVTDNRFEANGKFGAYIYRALPAKFSGNFFSGQPTALMVSNFGSDPRIEGNRFERNETAILVDRAARPVLAGNLLRNNGTGIRLFRRSDPRVEGNRLEQNRVAVSVAYSSYPTIRGNDFLGNDRALLLEFQSSAWEEEKGSAARESEVAARGAFGQAPRTEVSEEQRRPQQLKGIVDAAGNWWGAGETTELARIGATGNPSFIDDGRDSPTFVEQGRSYPLDKALFAPWSECPLTDAMDIKP